MKNLLFLFLVSTIALNSCKEPTHTQPCMAQAPTVKLVNFDMTDLKSMCFYNYKACCGFDSLISVDSFGQTFTFPNGLTDTFNFREPNGPNTGNTYMLFSGNNLKISMRNGIEIKLSNFIQSDDVCPFTLGQNGSFCQCDLLGFDLTSVNCVTQKIDNTTAFVVK